MSYLLVAALPGEIQEARGGEQLVFAPVITVHDAPDVSGVGCSPSPSFFLAVAIADVGLGCVSPLLDGSVGVCPCVCVCVPAQSAAEKLQTHAPSCPGAGAGHVASSPKQLHFLSKIDQHVPSTLRSVPPTPDQTGFSRGGGAASFSSAVCVRSIL